MQPTPPAPHPVSPPEPPSVDSAPVSETPAQPRSLWRQLLGFIATPEFWIQLVVLAGGGVLLFFLAMYGLMPLLTRQGATARVPDVEKLTYAKAKERLETFRLESEVLDSQYVHDLPRGAVLKQIPEAGATVKPGRKVYLILNKTTPPNTTVPDILDVNLQQAKYVLGNWGLNVGKVTYVAGDARDLVVKMTIKGQELRPGASVKQGSAIDLEVSRGYGGQPVAVPSLAGRTLDEATSLLNAASLSVGRVVYGNAPAGTREGTVFDQRPSEGEVAEGTAVDLFIAGKPPALPEGD